MLLSENLCQIHNFFYLQLLRQKLKLYVVNNCLGMSNWKQIPFWKIMLSCLICALFLAHLTYCHHWASVVRPSVNFSHFNQLLWSHWANLNQTLVEWSLDGLLPKMCPVILTSNQDGRQAKNRKKGGWNCNCPLLL
jgi:hypothetical protein